MNTDGEELIADLLDGIVDSLDDVPDEMLERTQNLYDDVGGFRFATTCLTTPCGASAHRGQRTSGPSSSRPRATNSTSTPWPLGTFGRKHHEDRPEEHHR